MSTRNARPASRTAIALVVAFLGAAVAIGTGTVTSAHAAGEWADFGTPRATSTFVDGVTFSQPVTVSQEVGRAELLLTFADAIGPTVIEAGGPGGTGADTLSYVLDPNAEGHLLPNTPLSARWRLTAADDPTDIAVGPPVRITYADDRFKWQTDAGDLVKVHWYEGSQTFGSRALKVGEDAVEQAAELLQVTESDPVDFYVYADQDAFYDALGPGTRENVGGQANAEIRTMFALIPTNEIDQPWVGIVIPHELTHLVFDTAARNPYHFPPRWLNEGLAVYLSQGYDASDRADVEGAAQDGMLIPLTGLTGQFPTSYDRFSLAYSESVAAVDYLIREHGRDPLVSLIRSYAEGRTDDEAFSAAIGQDMTEFGDAWLADLGAAPPTRYGPRPAPPGPIPSAWGGQGGESPAASPGSTGAPGAPGGPVSGGTSDSTGLLIAILGVAVAIGVLVVAVVLRRRQPRPGPG
jgi:hypothetical protein